MKSVSSIATAVVVFSPLVNGLSTSRSGTGSINNVNIPYFMDEVHTPTSQLTTKPFGISQTETSVTTEKQSPMSGKVPKAKKNAVSRKNPAHKEGVFSPVVYLAKDVVGEKKINEIRGKFISLHSGVIKDFVATYDSWFGRRAIQDMFIAADIDRNGEIDSEEMKELLLNLGFTHLKEKQMNGIFKRADTNGDGVLSMEEFSSEIPNTLKTNLVKLAKKNGGEMGLLV